MAREKVQDKSTARLHRNSVVSKQSRITGTNPFQLYILYRQRLMKSQEDLYTHNERIKKTLKKGLSPQETAKLQREYKKNNKKIERLREKEGENEKKYKIYRENLIC